MAPVSNKLSQFFFERVRIAGVKVRALVDTGATTSCCRWGWYKKWKSHMGPLDESDNTVTGIENSPIKVKGVTKPLEFTMGPCRELFAVDCTRDSDGCRCYSWHGCARKA